MKHNVSLFIDFSSKLLWYCARARIKISEIVLLNEKLDFTIFHVYDNDKKLWLH